MKLTGKAKEDFEKWFFKDCAYEANITQEDGVTIGQSLLNSFYSHSEFMKYGVYVDFFDSVGVEIVIMTSDIKEKYLVTINDFVLEYFKTRQEARAEAIKKANEIYNEQE